MESYLATSWIDPATATAHQKLMENVPTMENAEKCVIYKATCRICDESYIGQTQPKLKDCMGQHLNDVNSHERHKIGLLCKPLCTSLQERSKTNKR
jgi:hypothetical protein